MSGGGGGSRGIAYAKENINKQLNNVIREMSILENTRSNIDASMVSLDNCDERSVDDYVENEKTYNYKVVKPKPLISGKKIVSSSLIRNLLENGFLEKANKQPHGVKEFF